MRAVILMRGFAFGGIERYVLSIIEGLGRRGVSWEVWHPNPEFVSSILGRLDASIRALCRVVETDVTHCGRVCWTHFRTAWRVFRAIR